jgi:hypothetical protein
LNEAAIPVALFVGDWAAAERYIETFVRQSAQHALTMLHARALGAQGVLASKRGDPVKGVQFIRDALRELDKSGYHAYPLLLGSLAEALGAVGEIKEGSASLEAALSRCERNGERWYIADLLRIKGELILRSSDPQAYLKAETEFSSSLQWARRQGALSWELRRPRVSRGFGESSVSLRRRESCWDRFTPASPKVSRQQTCGRRERCWTNWHNSTSVSRHCPWRLVDRYLTARVATDFRIDSAKPIDRRARKKWLLSAV